MARVVPGDRLGMVSVFGEGECAALKLCGDDLAVVFGVQIEFHAQFFRPLGVGVAPHHVASRARGDHGIRAGLFDGLDVLFHRLSKELPLAGYQHGRGAATFFLTQVGEVHPGLIQQAHAGHADVLFST